MGMQLKSGKSENSKFQRRGPETNLFQYAMTIEASWFRNSMSDK